jgi:hypothetical protein
LIEPRQTKITARLAAQGAMLEEVRALVPVIRPEPARADVRKAVLNENILRRASLGSREKIFTKLSVRYFRVDAPQSVARFVRAMQTTTDPVQGGLFSYSMLLWNDALVFLLGCEWLAPKLKGLSFSAETNDIEIELGRLSKQVPEIKRWTKITLNRVAQHYLGLLRDFGYATGSARKLLKRPFISPEVVLFGAQLIVGGGESVSSLPDHLIFKAMGLSVKDVISAFMELREQGLVKFAIQGGVTHFNVRDEVTKDDRYIAET